MLLLGGRGLLFGSGHSAVLKLEASHSAVRALSVSAYNRGCMWHISALYRPCIGHRTGYSLHENARISGLASADFEGVFAHSYKRWRPRLFLRALRKEPS